MAENEASQSDVHFHTGLFLGLIYLGFQIRIVFIFGRETNEREVGIGDHNSQNTTGIKTVATRTPVGRDVTGAIVVVAAW